MLQKLFSRFQSPAKGTEITLKITGMHCQSCALNIDNTLEELEGVFASQTNFAKGSVVANIDAEKVSLAKMKKAIESLGYSVE